MKRALLPLIVAGVLAGTVSAQTLAGEVVGSQKVNATTGGFSGTLSHLDDFGSALSAYSFDDDGVTDLAVGAPRDDEAEVGVGVNRGAVWLLMLNGDATVKSHVKISDAAGGFTGSLDDSDEFGAGVAWLGDLDGDDIPDLAVGAPGDDDGSNGTPTDNNYGAVWILFLNEDGTVKSHQKISATQGGFTGVIEDIDQFGRSVTCLGDLDNDTVPDLAVGAPLDCDGGFNFGAVWILFLNADGTVKAHQKISALAGGFTGMLDVVDSFGRAVAAMGDLDGDTVEDLAVGVPGDDDGGTGTAADFGAVWLLFLNVDGTVKGHQKISATAGAFVGGGGLMGDDNFGVSVASLGDLDCDGNTDLAVGALNDGDGGPNTGAVYVLLLDDDQLVKSDAKISDKAGNLGSTLLDFGDNFGSAVAGLGAFDGDDALDLVVGAKHLNAESGSDLLGGIISLFLSNATWSDLGFALGGGGPNGNKTDEKPILIGKGPLLPLSAVELELTLALKNSLTLFVLGIERADFPFKGGTMVPLPIYSDVFMTNSAGALTLAGALPDINLAGVDLYTQFWIQDTTQANSLGFSASNAVQGIKPLCD